MTTTQNVPGPSRQIGSGASDTRPNQYMEPKGESESQDNTKAENDATMTSARNDQQGLDKKEQDVKGIKQKDSIRRQADQVITKKTQSETNDIERKPPSGQRRSARSSNATRRSVLDSQDANRSARDRNMTLRGPPSSRAEPLGRERSTSFLPEISQQSSAKSTKGADNANANDHKTDEHDHDDDDDDDDDDGGWLRHPDEDAKQKDKQPRRNILRTGKNAGSQEPNKTVRPLSKTLVLQNGRIPAAKQQSTLFKDVKVPKLSPRPDDFHHTKKLPALSGRSKRGSPLPGREANKPPVKNTIQTTLRGEPPSKGKSAAKKTKMKLSKSETNYVRFAKIVARVGSDLLRLAFYNYLDRQQPPKKLQQFLAANKRRLLSYATTFKLISRRWDVMFPGDDETKANLQKLDSALVFWFLRYICLLKRPNDFIWKRKPASDDVTETGDITRIRDARNFLLNLSSPALYDDEFDRKVEEFKQMTLRLCGERHGGDLVKIIDQMTTETVRYSEREQYLDVLTQWADETGDRQIAPAKTGEGVRERKEMTNRFLARHRIPQMFVRTKIFLKAKDRLTKNGCVILKGNIGDGKTTTAIALMVTMFDEDECLLISHPDQWQFIEVKKVSVVLLDDIFGGGSLDEDLLTRWEKKFDEIYECCQATGERSGVKVIITIRQHILDQCYNSRLAKYRLFSRDNIVECTSPELYFAEKRAMLGKHLMAEDKSVSKTEIDKAAKVHNSKLGFPECCALFVKKESFLIIGSQFFERPIELLFETLDKMYDGDKYGYLALVILLLQKDGILFVKKLKDFKEGAFKTKVLDLAFLCKVPISDHLNTFTLQALENQVRCYVGYYADRKCYTFAHESIIEAIMASFGERHPEEVLEGCALPFLMDFVGTDENFDERPDKIFMMRVKKESFLVLAKVFEQHLLSGEVKRIAQHRAFKDLRFIEFLFEYLTQKENFVTILLSEDKQFVDLRDGRRKVGFLYGAIDQEVPNVELVTAILKSGVHSNKTSKAKWCRAELESSLCLAVKRGSYDIYKDLIGTGVKPPDHLFQEEQYLVSVDIVRDLLSRRHWSDEQKDVALVRASRGIRPESQEIVTLLLQEGASLNSIRAGSTALCEGVKSGKLKTVLLLLTSGASVNDRDATQQTPLHHACDWNNIEVVKILLKRNADVNARDTLGFTPFLVAAGWGRETIMELLLTKKVNSLVMDDQENNVLHICAANGQSRIMKMLLAKFPQELETILIARNRHGWTPLDFALRCGHLNATKLLIHVILKCSDLKTQPRTFVHTRFFVVKLEDFDADEKYQYRFLADNVGQTCYQMPRCNWFIQAGNRDEYEEVRLFSMKYENKLRQCLAKS